MKLYGIASSRALRSLWAAEEVGVEYEHVPTHFLGDSKKPEYLAINPNGKVPTLVDGDTTLWESNAILCYLGGKSDTDLWPKSAKRYDILRWMFWEANHFTQAINKIKDGESINMFIRRRNREFLVAKMTK